MNRSIFNLILPLMMIGLLTACEKETLTNSPIKTQFASLEVRASENNFTTPLSGANEVPPNDSKAVGTAIVKIANDEASISFRLIVANADSVTAAHFHMAPEGMNGPVVASLFGGPVTGQQNGVLSEGTITASDVVGPLAGNLDTLIQAIRDGTIYVNVHSVEYPGGEIRGQLD